MELDRSVRIYELFSLYGLLLSPAQAKMIDLYYQKDLSLGEIAELESISRNAVHDSLKKAIAALEKYDSLLGLMNKREEILNYLDELKKNSSKEQQILIKKIEERLN